MHIDGNYFVNFADSKATLSPDPNVILNYGQSLNDESMRNFAAYFYVLGGKDWRLGDYSQKGHLQQFYLQMIGFNELRNKTPKAPQPLESWFPDIQVLTLRSTEGSAKGLFLGAKAGSNCE